MIVQMLASFGLFTFFVRRPETFDVRRSACSFMIIIDSAYTCSIVGLFYFSRGILRFLKNFYFLLLTFKVLFTKVVICDDEVTGVKKFCREKDRLVISDELDEYLVVDAEYNTTIILECRFCEDKRKNQPPKIWHWQDREQEMQVREVRLDMDNNATLNRLGVTYEFSLVIKQFSPEDVGIYRCYGIHGLEKDHHYNYRLESVFEELNMEYLNKKNFTDWEEFQNANYSAVTEEFATGDVEEFTFIRDSGVKLEVFPEVGTWSPCEKCTNGRKGVRKRRAYCRLKSELTRNVSEDPPSDIVKFFTASPLLPCRSRLLGEHFPAVSNETRNLPDFLLTEKCKRCKKEKKGKRRKFKYKKRITLSEGAYFSLSCPEATPPDSTVIWKKDALMLRKGSHSFRKKDPKPRVLVDTYFGLYLQDVSEDESGTYTCFVDNQKMMQAKVHVIKKSGILTAALLRHMGYLSVILMIAFAAYCIGLVRNCKNREKFITYEKLKEENNE